MGKTNQEGGGLPLPCLRFPDVPSPPFPLAGRPACHEDERLMPRKSAGAGRRPDAAVGHGGSAGTGA